MGVVVVMAHGGIVPPRSERVLRGGHRATERKSIVAGDRGNAERGGGASRSSPPKGGRFRARERLERGVEQYAHLAMSSSSVTSEPGCGQSCSCASRKSAAS